MGRGSTAFARTADDEVAAQPAASDPIDPAWVGSRACVRCDALLIEAVKQFRATPELRMVAVVDAFERPIGAVFERDVRQLLFSPFGYALLSNRSLAIGLDDHLLPCPVVAIDGGAGAALAAWQREAGAEGLIVTDKDRFLGTIDQPTLLRIAAERDAANSRRAGRRAAAIQVASRRFEEDARTLASELALASHSVAETAERMAERAQQIGDGTAAVAGATVQASTNLAEVADRTRAFASALVEVEASTVTAQHATAAAVSRARSGGRQIDGLVQAADSIGAVTALIDDIARHTTMLALNATIEAARGDGSARGFTVVAKEVKALATQTRTAAAGITGDIDRVRGAIGGVRETQGELADAVDTLDGIASAVADAAGEQSRAGRQISAHVAEASTATDHIRSTVGTILHSARAAGDDATAMSDLAGSLAARADELEQHMLRFLDAMAAA